MARLRSFLAALSLLVASLTVGTIPVSAQKTPEKIRLTPQSRDGAVLLRVDTIGADYALSFQRAGAGGFGSRVYMIDVARGTGSDVYVARTLKPGRYRLDSIWQQKRWGLVFAQQSVAFDVKAGVITYLGKLETRPLLVGLQRETKAAGKASSGFRTEDHDMVPAFGARDAGGFADAVAFARRVMLAGPDMVALGALHEIRAGN